MKIVLREDVVSLGVEGDIIEVADGYARNFLIPKKQAELVTPGVLKDLELRRGSLAKKEEKRISNANKEAAKFEGKNVKISVQINEEGHLYGAVNISEVATAMSEQLKEEIDKSKVIIAEQIKETGKFKIKYRVHPQVEATLNLEVSGRETASDESSSE